MDDSYIGGGTAKKTDVYFWLMTATLLLAFGLQLAGIVNLKKPSAPPPLLSTVTQQQLLSLKNR